MPETGLDLVARSFAHWIYHQDNVERIERYKKYEEYYQGDFDYYVPPKIKEALGSDFRVIAGYPRTIVNKAVGYLCGKPLSSKLSLTSLKSKEIEDEKSASAETGI